MPQFQCLVLIKCPYIIVIVCMNIVRDLDMTCVQPTTASVIVAELTVVVSESRIFLNFNCDRLKDL